MAHYAFLDENNVVTEVITGRNEDEVANGISDWESYYGELRGQVCKRTSYNSYRNTYLDPMTGEVTDKPAFRGNYASIGYTYDSDLDAFIPPSPFSSWLFDPSVMDWVAPTPPPTDGSDYMWDEETLTWVVYPLPAMPVDPDFA
jgi:hypothetical protein